MLEFMRWVWVILAAIALFLSSWVIIPAPTMALLPLGVGAAEISPILMVGNAILLLGSLVSNRFSGTASRLWLSTPDGLGGIILVCSALGLGLSSIPLLQLPSTLSQSEQRMQTGLGPQYLAGRRWVYHD